MVIDSFQRIAIRIACDLIAILYVDYKLRGQPLKERTNVPKPVGVAQKRLHLKPSKKTTQKIYKPRPEIVKSSMYDEHWAAKQERGKSGLVHGSPIEGYNGEGEYE